jgi:[phosphatase 2A protein]-leucine-carboxy methyltransferase
VQIVSLGAGYDTRFFRLQRDLQTVWNAAYFEVDLDTVMEVKRAIIEDTPKLKESALRGNLCTLAADLNDPKQLAKQLSRTPQFDPLAPTLVLAECLLMYLAKDAADQLLSYWAAVPDALVHREFLLFDPILRADRFGEQMLENLRSWGVDDVAFQAYPTPEAVVERFARCGFAQATMRCWSMLQLESSEDTTHLVAPSERLLLQQKAALDEYEEWSLMAQHYILLHATLSGQ